MYDYKAMSLFTTVVELGSMQAAAEKWSVTPSAITQAIQKLESQLNVKLLNRTTRRLSLTDAGEQFYQHTAQMQQSAEKAVKSIELLRAKAVGELTIACVTGLMDSELIATFKAVLAEHTDLRIHFRFEDQVLDLFEQRVDIALRAGKGILNDNLIARHLYDVEWRMVASPDYLAQRAKPADLTDLAELDWIDFSNPNLQTIPLTNGTQSTHILPRYRVRCNTLYASRQLTLQGFGVSCQPIDGIRQHLASGRLVPLFCEWHIPPVPLYLVTLQRIQSEKVRLACECIVDYFARQQVAALASDR